MANKLMMSPKEECDNYNLITETIDKLVDMCDNAEAIALRDELFELFTTKYSEPLYEILGLQEELGCPMDVFVKALTNGVYVIDEETKELQCILRGIYTFTGEGLGTNAGFSDERIWRKKVNKAGIEFYPIYFWKDYKKTWWLKQDKSE